MSTGAIIMMLIGMIVIWGGAVASIAHALKASKN